MILKNVFKSPLNTSGGFTLLEALVAMIVFSLGFMALSSLSISVVGGNTSSRRYLEAVAQAQYTLEGLRCQGYNLGTDAILNAPGTGDDVISAALVNSNTGNDGLTKPADLFASPDHAYDGTVMNDANGRRTFVENGILLNSPALTIDYYPRLAWVVRDNYPVANMKTITVVVGWLEGSGVPHYLTLSSAIQEKRYLCYGS